MFNPSRVVINAFVGTTINTYNRAFPNADPAIGSLLEQAGHMALEALANTDCAYHDLNHTILVTDVGQSILLGRLMSQGDVTPFDWLHATIAMLYHDIGFIRGLLKGDRDSAYITGGQNGTIVPPSGSTDAIMGPYHVNRGALYIRERFAAEPLIEVETLAKYIEMTRFPVPEDAYYQRVGDFAGLVRAADLIGQLADPQYIQKLSKLYAEFEETREAEQFGYSNPGELRAGYPSFFFNYVRPYISEGLRYLRKTQTGQQWIANLFAHVYSEQQCEPNYGPERKIDHTPNLQFHRRASDKELSIHQVAIPSTSASQPTLGH
ncbi:MAG: hypothetical protein KUG75_11645 [Pseudomonadales bacterium]|nr:hypothetical protein [Pseudomonadales bacterium]